MLKRVVNCNLTGGNIIFLIIRVKFILIDLKVKGKKIEVGSMRTKFRMVHTANHINYIK